jgi:hypothetical protein
LYVAFQEIWVRKKTIGEGVIHCTPDKFFINYFSPLAAIITTPNYLNVLNMNWCRIRSMYNIPGIIGIAGTTILSVDLSILSWGYIMWYWIDIPGDIAGCVGLKLSVIFQFPGIPGYRRYFTYLNWSGSNVLLKLMYVFIILILSRIGLTPAI